MKASFEQSRLVELQNAACYAEWSKAALELDSIDGLDKWKEDPNSPAYDHKLLQKRLTQFRDARATDDLSKAIFLLRTSVSRNFAGMGNPELYVHTNIGTKFLVEDYISEVRETIQFLLRDEGQSISNDDKLHQLTYLHQAYGRTALLLSGGGTLGMNHIGVVAVLIERNTLPRIISGSSAGSIVAGVCGTRTDDELPQLLIDFIHADLNVFQDSFNPETIYDHIARLARMGAWSDISYLTKVMQDLLGNLTFQEAYNRTRRILNITVSTANTYELPRLLNYLTAPDVLIWSAIAASCSVPFMFSTYEILAKHPKTGHAQPWNTHPERWIDGSVDNDLPMAKLSELFNVNHFIVSQVNPHIVPFLEKSSIVRRRFYNSRTNHGDKGLCRVFLNALLDEITHQMDMFSKLGIFPVLCNKMRAMLMQRYSGDITVVPDISYRDYLTLLSNPGPELLKEAKRRGSRATWPKVSIIHDHCAIELAIDDAVHAMHAKMILGNTRPGLHHFRHLSYQPRIHHSIEVGNLTSQKRDNASRYRQNS